MNEKELDQLSEKEQYDVKYMSELRQYWNVYSYALINEIFVGVGINLGLSEKEAYDLAKYRPGEMQKAKFFRSIFDKFKNIFKYKIPKFRVSDPLYKKEKPMTPKQWKKFNKEVDSFWLDRANKVAEDVGIKSFLLGKDTTSFREKKKPYKNKSLFQVDFEQYDNSMPENLLDAYQKYNFNDSEKKIMNKAYSGMALYVTNTNDKIKEAIRQQIQSGLDNNKTPIQVASDLYWQVEKNENLVNNYTAEALRKDWNRVSSTEMASVYEAGILAEYESEAMESLKDPQKAKYFVRTGGSCDWCLSKRGTLVRLVPAEIVQDQKNESLRSMGIKDPNTDIAIWVGKNNIGLKQKDWMIATPGHPYNVATFQPIDLSKEHYDKKTDNIEKNQKKEKFIPQQKDYTYKSKEEKEYRKPQLLDNNLVRFNNNLYESVSAEEYNKKLEEYNKNPMLPIPVNKKSPSYRRIFEEAQRNK